MRKPKKTKWVWPEEWSGPTQLLLTLFSSAVYFAYLARWL